jgi:hypothetical protein
LWLFFVPFFFFFAVFVPLGFFFDVLAAVFPLLDEVCPELRAEVAVESPEVWPDNGTTTIRTQSRPDTHRAAGREMEIREEAALIYSL